VVVVVVVVVVLIEYREGESRAALTGKHDTLVRRAHQMLNAAMGESKHLTPLGFLAISPQQLNILN